ncbi:hypothetical protein N8I74_09525 [Chitiniphilus purpureus]|uniref:Acid-shock protein n=1 Tax=Chitiniphilus purpureus TaxID=2981137 RepID=A0ABY6DVZ5_9NEIS|nr:hypothetical protein [Chitiniphilus sp. CD1]UXY17226.1 hypothetical protein N8I74_09525 [Chitiniphilus sp. CD1]
MKKLLVYVLALALSPAFAVDEPLPFDEPAYAPQVIRASAQSPQKRAVLGKSKYSKKFANKSSRKHLASRKAKGGKYAAASKRTYAQKGERRQLAANTRR